MMDACHQMRCYDRSISHQMADVDMSVSDDRCVFDKLSVRMAVPVRVTCPDTLAGVIPGGTAGVVAEWNGGAAVRGAPARNARYGRLRLSADVWSSSAFWYVLMFGSLACGVAMQPGELFMSESAVWINDCVPTWPAASGLYNAIISS